MNEKCINDEKYFVSQNFLEVEPSSYSKNVSQKFIYNSELKTCLVNISRITSPLNWYHEIMDIYTGKEITGFTLYKKN